MSDAASHPPRTSTARWGRCAEPLTLLAGRHYRLDLDRLGQLAWTTPDRRWFDLLHLAASIYAVDRLAGREHRRTQSDCSRELQVTLGVSDLDFWDDDRVRSLVIDVLETLSEDLWDIRFVAWGGVDPESQRRLLRLPDDLKETSPLVCLYSGGLDSAAGLGLRIDQDPGRPVVPVTVRHQSAQRRLVRDQYCLLRERTDVRMYPLVVPFSMVRPSRLVPREETSQRTRAFLFSALGGVAASLLGASTVEVFESGVGVVNLPFMAGMIGSRMTCSCHPGFFRLMSRLVSEVSGRDISFTFPHLGRTKGEMVRGLAEMGLHELAQATVSCVHFPLRHKRTKQCGVCPACILRRQALLAAGIEEPTGRYRFDLFGPTAQAEDIPEDRLGELKAILGQVVRLSEFDGQGEIPRRFRRHLLGSGVIGDDVPQETVVGVLQRYRREWLDLAQEGARLGWKWTGLLSDPTGVTEKGLSHAAV